MEVLYMKYQKSILNFQIFSIIFVSILGTLLHFTYGWSNGNLLIGLFSAVNESTWEHLKLLFFPMFLTIPIGMLYLSKKTPNLLCAKTIGIIISICFLIIFFYTYTGIIGKNFAIINIISFFISVILGEYVAYKIMLSNLFCNSQIAIIVLVILLLLFVTFTFFTPKIELFKDPLTNKYGILPN